MKVVDFRKVLHTGSFISIFSEGENKSLLKDSKPNFRYTDRYDNEEISEIVPVCRRDGTMVIVIRYKKTND